MTRSDALARFELSGFREQGFIAACRGVRRRPDVPGRFNDAWQSGYDVGLAKRPTSLETWVMQQAQARP